MKRGKKELKARMVTRQQKNNRKITHLNALLRQKEEALLETKKELHSVYVRLDEAHFAIRDLQIKKWYQFVPFKFHG